MLFATIFQGVFPQVIARHIGMLGPMLIFHRSGMLLICQMDQTLAFYKLILMKKIL